MLNGLPRGGHDEWGRGMRAQEWLYRATVGLAGFALVLVVAYIVLVQENRSVQADVNRRQQFINQSIQLARVSEALIRALASAAANGKDENLRELLAQNGITINAAGEPEKAASPAAAPAGAAR